MAGSSPSPASSAALPRAADGDLARERRPPSRKKAREDSRSKTLPRLPETPCGLREVMECAWLATAFGRVGAVRPIEESPDAPCCVESGSSAALRRRNPRRSLTGNWKLSLALAHEALPPPRPLGLCAFRPRRRDHRADAHPLRRQRPRCRPGTCGVRCPLRPRSRGLRPVAQTESVRRGARRISEQLYSDRDDFGWVLGEGHEGFFEEDIGQFDEFSHEGDEGDFGRFSGGA